MTAVGLMHTTAQLLAICQPFPEEHRDGLLAAVLEAVAVLDPLPAKDRRRVVQAVELLAHAESLSLEDALPQSAPNGAPRGLAPVVYTPPPDPSTFELEPPPSEPEPSRKSSRGGLGNAALTDAQVRKYRKAFAAGTIRVAELAETTGLSHPSLYAMLKGQTYRHVPLETE